MKGLTGVSITVLTLLLTAFSAKAQTNFSLKQAIEYALLNNENVLIAELNRQDADARVYETAASGLPQISGAFGYANNLKIQQVFLPAAFDVSGKTPSGGTFPAAFGVQHGGNLGITATQLIWDGSFFIGVKAAKMLREKMNADQVKAEYDVIEQVSKAYYLVLVNQSRGGLIDLNIANLDATLKEARALYENGFAEKIEVSRLQVQLNNLKAEKSGVEQAISASMNILKWSMGMPVGEQMVLSDRLESIDFEYDVNELTSYSAAERIEVQQINYLRRLAELDIKKVYAAYIPKVTFNANWGRNSGNSRFANLWSDAWFTNAAVGLNVSIPIFDGLRKKHTLQRKRIQLQTLDNRHKQLTNSLSLQLLNARKTLDVSLERLQVQKANLELAREVNEITREKYREGLDSNLEVLNADKDYKQAETNYLSTLYEAIIAKIDLDKALGKLKNKP